MSRRTPSGYSMPAYSSSQNAVIVPLDILASNANVKIACSFLRPTTASPAISGSSSYVYASSALAPSSIDNPASAFSQHSSIGSFSGVNFAAMGTGATNPSTPDVPATSMGNSTDTTAPSTGDAIGMSSGPLIASTPDQYVQILIIHGVLFFLAWTVAPFAGIFIARYMKNALGVWWYRLHMGLMLGVTGLFSLISFILILLFKADHFDCLHPVSCCYLVTVTDT